MIPAFADLEKIETPLEMTFNMTGKEKHRRENFVQLSSP